MGGSGGGGGRTSSPRPTIFTCEDLKFETILASPIAEVLELIEKGDEMEITISSTGNSCVVIFRSKIAGSIVASNLLQLINCLKSGNRFIAIVKSIEGAKCKITVVHESAL